MQAIRSPNLPPGGFFEEHIVSKRGVPVTWNILIVELHADAALDTEAQPPCSLEGEVRSILVQPIIFAGGHAGSAHGFVRLSLGFIVDIQDEPRTIVTQDPNHLAYCRRSVCVARKILKDAVADNRIKGARSEWDMRRFRNHEGALRHQRGADGEE